MASDEPIQRFETQTDLLKLINTLPSHQRIAIGLRFYADLTDVQIADAMGCSSGAVRGYLSRALTTLREQETSETG